MSRHQEEYVVCDDCGTSEPLDDVDYSGNWSLDNCGCGGCEYEYCPDCAENYVCCDNCGSRGHVDEMYWCEQTGDVPYCYQCQTDVHEDTYQDLLKHDPEEAKEFWDDYNDCTTCNWERSRAKDASFHTQTGRLLASAV